MVSNNDQTFPTIAESVNEAFAGLVRSRLEDSYRLAWLVLRNERDAEDAAHDAFVAAWRGRQALRDPNRIDAWFGRILVNSCRQYLRRSARRPTVALGVEPEQREVAPYTPTDDREDLTRAFMALSADQRTVVVLRFYRDMSVNDIARTLHARPGTIKSRLHHAMRNLREALQADGPEVDQ